MRTALSSCLCLLSLCAWVQAQTTQRQTVINGGGGLATNGPLSQVTSIAQPVSVGTSTNGPLRNQAGFLSEIEDISLARLEAFKSVELILDADGDGKPSPGDTLRYTVSVSNLGAIDATGVELVDLVTTNTLTTDTNSVNVVPTAVANTYSTTAGVQLVVSSPGVLDNDSDFDNQPSLLTVGSSDTLSAGGGAVNVAPDGGFTYESAVGFSGTDSFTYEVTDGLATDSALVTIAVAEAADLSVVKTDDVDPVSTGATLTYTVIVSNAGPTVASEVTVTDTLPTGVTLSMVSGGIFACSNPAPGVVMCTGGPLAAGATAAITIPVTPNSGGVTLTNTVTVSTTAFDVNPGNDTAIEETVVNANDPPVATNDSYTTFGNVRLSIDMTSGVLSNDTDPNMDMLVVSDFDTNSALTGVVAVAANGSFTYDPPAGVVGTDSWTYVVSDGVATDTGTVTVAIGGPTVWFVDNRVTGPGTGTQADPFNNLSSLQGNEGAGDTDQPGDVIFIYEGTGAAYTGGLDVEADQRLLGEPAGLALSGKVIVPAAGNRPRITHTSEATKLGTNVELDSVDFDSNGNFGVSGLNFGTLTMNNVSASSQGRGGLFLSTGTANLTGISCTSSNSSTEGLTLLSVDGSVQITGGSISGANGAAVRITGGSALVTVACSILNNAGPSLQVINRIGGSVTLSGTITDTGSGILVQNNSAGTVTLSGASKVLNTGSSTAVNLNNNTGATINFTNGGLDIDTTSGTGFNASGGGTVTVVGMGNSIVSGSGTGLNVTSVTIASSGLTFQRISVNGAANGIVLNATGTQGGLSVTGDGTTSVNGSGGTLQNTTSSAVDLDNTRAVSLNQLNISTTADSGISINSVTNFTYTRSAISNGGANDDEDSIEIRNLFGDSLIESVTFNQINEQGIDHSNTTANDGTRDLLVVRGCTFNDHQALFGESGILVQAAGTSRMGISIENCTFTINANGALGTVINSTGTSDLFTLISNCTFNAANAFGAGTIQIVNAGDSTAENVIVGNNIDQTGLTGIIVNNDDNATSTAIIRGNSIEGDFSVSQNGFGLQTRQDEDGSFTVLIDDNDFDGFGFDYIRASARDTVDGSGVLNATITNNRSTTSPNDIGAGIQVLARDINTICVDIRGNNIMGSNTFSGFDDDIIVDQVGSATLNIEQSSGANISSVNNGATVFVSGTPNFSGGNCASP